MLGHLLLYLLVPLPLLLLELLLLFGIKYAQVKHFRCHVGVCKGVHLLVEEVVVGEGTVFGPDHAISNVQQTALLRLCVLFGFIDKLLLGFKDFVVFLEGVFLQVSHVEIDVEELDTLVNILFNVF